jgi:hypothetical protein
LIHPARQSSIKSRHFGADRGEIHRAARGTVSAVARVRTVKTPRLPSFANHARRAAALTAALAILGPRSVALADVTQPHPGLTLVRHPGQSAMVIADLCAAGVSVRTTKYAERKGTPQAWAGVVGAQVAMNADFFDFPGWTYVIGRARGAGEEWPAGAQQKENRPFWEFGPAIAEGQDNGASAPLAGVTEIVGGHNVIISGGATTGPWAAANDGALLNSTHARSAIGTSKDRRTLYLLSTTTAISATTLVTWLQGHAAEGGAPAIDWATNQDGGGSSQLYVQNLGQVISTGREVNNHIGIFATGAGDPTMCNDQPPKGYLDAAGCDYATGWAQDTNVATTAIQVQLGFGGEPGDAGVTTETLTADLHRDDLCAAIGSCNHGFQTLAPFSLFDNAAHAVHAVGLDADGARNVELSSSPRTMTCAPPELKGVLRHVVDPASYAAWGFVAFVDELPQVTDAAIAALTMSTDLAQAPRLIRADDGSPEVWLVDGPTGNLRRHVPSPAVAVDWHLDLGKVVILPKAEVDALDLAPDLRSRPTLVKGPGPAVYLLDDDLTPPAIAGSSTGVGGAGGATFGAGGHGGSGGAGGGGAPGSADEGQSCSCAVPGQTGTLPAPGMSGALALLGLRAACRRRGDRRARRRTRR